MSHSKRVELDPIESPFLNVVLDVVPQLISYVNSDYVYVYANASYLKWFGHDRENCIGKHVSEVIGTEAFNLAKAQIDKALSGHKVVYQATFPFKSGGSKTIEVTMLPDTNTHGLTRGFINIVTDVTALHQAQDKLTESEAWLKALYEFTPLGTLMLSSQGEIITANPAYQTMLEYSLEELKGKSIFAFTFKDDLNISGSKLQQAATVKDGVNRFRKRYVTKSGRIIWAQVTSRPIDPTDPHTNMVSIIEDVTHLIQLESEHEQAQSKLFSSGKMSALGEMAGGIAHEINNPLAIIKGRAGQIKRKVSEPQVDLLAIADHANRIEQTTDRIARIIKGLRAFSRSSEHDPMSVVPITGVIDDTLELCQERFRNHGVELRVTIETTENLECRPAQISQVLLNLLNNSFDAVHPLAEKWIEVHAMSADQGLKISVQDSGAGISQEIQDKIMQPFFTTKDVGKGTGLGLSISLGIAQDHNGSLKYETKSEHTRFVLELPLRQPKKESKVS